MRLEGLERSLGAADIKLAGLRIWVHGRQFPEATDYWDGNWLNITAHCQAQSAEVWANGPLVHLSEFVSWIEACERMHRTLAGEANLDCMEPELSVRLSAENLGHIAMLVKITPDHLTQQHWFKFAVEQSYLTELIRDCRSLLSKVPLKAGKK